MHRRRGVRVVAADDAPAPAPAARADVAAEALRGSRARPRASFRSSSRSSVRRRVDGGREIEVAGVDERRDERAALGRAVAVLDAERDVPDVEVQRVAVEQQEERRARTPGSAASAGRARSAAAPSGDRQRLASCRALRALGALDDVEEHVFERRRDRVDRRRPRCRRRAGARRASSGVDAARRAARRARRCRTGWSSRPPASRRARASRRPAGRRGPRRSGGRRTPASPRWSCRSRQAAGVDQRDAMAALGLVEVVRGDEHGDARRCDSASISRQNCRRDSGSTPPVGSSRNRIAGSCRIAQPSASRWRQPPARSRASVCSRPAQAGHLDARTRGARRAARRRARRCRRRSGCSDRRSAARRARTAATCSRCAA